MNLRHGIAAAALLSAAVLTVACSSPVTGIGAAASTAAVTSASSSGPTSTGSSTSAPSTTSTSSASASTTTVVVTTVSEPTVTIVVEPTTPDATTTIWLQNSCADVGTLFAALFAVPTVDETAPIDDYRGAYRDYYAALADTILGMTERMAPLDPPTIEDGQALHDGYLTYLIQLADIAGSGAIAIDEAVDAESIAAIIDQIDFEIERLGESDLGLADFQGEELQALMTAVPECADLVTT